MKIGVLALQGDFEAHAAMLVRCGAAVVEVRAPDELAGVDALVVPGGESTTMRTIAHATGIAEPLRARAAEGLPILGTCAGMILCAAEIADGDEPLMPVVDITVRRNAYGRQVQSFESPVAVDGVGSVNGVFIRAPRIERLGPSVEVIAVHEGEPVGVRAGAVTLLSFHPEIAGDHRIHEEFVRGL